MMYFYSITDTDLIMHFHLINGIEVNVTNIKIVKMFCKFKSAKHFLV